MEGGVIPGSSFNKLVAKRQGTPLVLTHLGFLKKCLNLKVLKGKQCLEGKMKFKIRLGGEEGAG